MSLANLSSNAQDYLKVIWGISEWSDSAATVSLLAERTGMKPSTVSGAMTKLASQGYVDKTPYGSITLTEEGTNVAVAMVRRHRLLESFLVTVLEYSWDEVHDEAERLEHAVSDLMINRIDLHLGFPTHDPHGDPIPTADGHIEPLAAGKLSDAKIPGRFTVARIADTDSEMLRFFSNSGIVVGSSVDVGEPSPYSGGLPVTVDGNPVTLGGEATDAIWVVNREPDVR